MIPLIVHLMLHRLRNWSIRNFTDASGNKCLHFCIPIIENGIEVSTKSGDPYMGDDDVKAVGWNYMASPSKKVSGNKIMYNLVPMVPKPNYEKMQEMGLIDPERKYIHVICGNISPWTYATRDYYEKRRKKDE